jgi:DNA-directed RNA polymerase specialized sigma24 family protein
MAADVGAFARRQTSTMDNADETKDEGPGEQAPSGLAESHGDAIRAYAAGLTGDPAAGEELAEQVLNRAGRHRAPVTGTPAAVRGWLLKITRGVVNDATARRLPATTTRDGELAGEGAGRPAVTVTLGAPGAAKRANAPRMAGVTDLPRRNARA